MRNIAIIFLLALSSCVTYQKCVDKFGVGEKQIKKEFKAVLDTTLKTAVKPDSLQGGIDADSLIHLVLQLQGKEKLHEKGDSIHMLEDDVFYTKHDSLLVLTKNQQMQLKLWYDRNTNQVKFKANKKADTIRVHLHDTVRVVADCPPAMVFDPVEKLPWYAPAKLWARYELFAAWVLLVLFGAGIIYSKFKR